MNLDIVCRQFENAMDVLDLFINKYAAVHQYHKLTNLISEPVLSAYNDCAEDKVKVIVLKKGIKQNLIEAKKIVQCFGEQGD